MNSYSYAKPVGFFCGAGRPTGHTIRQPTGRETKCKTHGIEFGDCALCTVFFFLAYNDLIGLTWILLLLVFLLLMHVFSENKQGYLGVSVFRSSMEKQA